MSNDVRIYSSRSKHAGSFDEATFLSSRIEASNDACLKKALSLVHTEAVKNAWQIRDTGLLANSIFYSMDNGQTIEGLNSAGGAHLVNVSEYKERLAKNGEIRKTERKFVSTGYVGTAVSHNLDTLKTQYTKEGSIKEGEYGTYQEDPSPREYAKYKDTTQYAPLVEYGTAHTAPRPFLKQAFESVRQQMERVIVMDTTASIKHVMRVIFDGGEK